MKYIDYGLGVPRNSLYLNQNEQSQQSSVHNAAITFRFLVDKYLIEIH